MIKLERMADVCSLKKAIIIYLFDFISKKKQDVWWKYKGQFEYEGETFNLECECKYDNLIFTYRSLFIEREQVIIDLTDKKTIQKYFGGTLH